MAKEEEPQPKTQTSYVLMTHICTACDEDCEVACKNGTCKLIQKDRNP